jgi:hypothetical protein
MDSRRVGGWSEFQFAERRDANAGRGQRSSALQPAFCPSVP